MSLQMVVDGLGVAATLYLRSISILFTRYHPIGHLYLVKIITSVAVYVTSAFVAASRGRSRQRRRSVASVLMFGLLDFRHRIASVVTVLINLLSMVCILDFLYRGQYLHQSQDLVFSRTGYVDDKSARIVVRAPHDAAVQMTVLSAADQTQRVEQIRTLSSATDFTATYTLEGLHPDTDYIYSTNASHIGRFKTLSTNPKRWSLVTSSCIKPFYPYNPLDHGLRVMGLEYLSTYLEAHPSDMMMFLGDFIYIDLPIPHGWTQQVYDTAYRQVYASPSWTPALKSMPWIHLYDDHEIANDWSANTTGLYQPAIHTFRNYQGLANPPSTLTSSSHLTTDQPTYYTFHRGAIAFFILDTRRYRSAPPIHPNETHATMLGLSQLAALQHWLATESSWKVVVSSVPFTRNWRGPDAADSWAGYLHEREIVLEGMRRTETGVVILSGDRHEHATTLFPPPSPSPPNTVPSSTVVEFSTSPLNQFFEPFRRYHREEDESDVNVFNYPWGNSKFGKVDFEIFGGETGADGMERETLRVGYTLVVAGEEVWNSSWDFLRRGGA